jgi:cystathionine beta-lyase/cystathionine gamma-synthase
MSSNLASKGFATRAVHAGERVRRDDFVPFAVRGAGQPQIFRFVNSLELFLKATTMGHLQSLVLYPAVSSHRDLAPRHRERLGITDNLVRISVGIEDLEDLKADLAQALKRIE